tara:strand:+ start:775 stop:1776 length:1002 start_codon:yes stop_codon:yes gene_type:complete
MADDEKRPIIIKKVIKKSGGHHGGAWKVAYADFVTAMMAFFLLLWLLNVTTDEQKELISAYFSPTDPRISESTSGSGGVLGGTTMVSEGALTDDNKPVIESPVSPSGEVRDAMNIEDSDLRNVEDDALNAEQARREAESFREAEAELRQAIETVPELQALAQNLLVDMTPEGLRIQIVDQQGKPMFPSGGITPLPDAVKLMTLVSGVIQDMPNMISVRGHTDARPFSKNASYGNWELSADRANASRRVLLSAGLDTIRINNIMGKAARDPLIAEDPDSAQNRRISIILLKQSLVPGIEDTAKDTQPDPRRGTSNQDESEPDVRKREEGIIYFP